MTEFLSDIIKRRFTPNVQQIGSCLLVWQRNEYDVAILIDTHGSRFMLVHKILGGYEFITSLSDLFSGYIYERDNRIIFEFEYSGSKNDKYILNYGCQFSSLKTAVLALQCREIDVMLTFAEDKKKIYYRYANNTFWNPTRKRYFSFNAKYDANARTGRYNRITDHNSIFDRGYFNIDY